MKKIFVLLLCLLILLPSAAFQEKQLTGMTFYFSNAVTAALKFDAKQAMQNEENRTSMALALLLDFGAYCRNNNYDIGLVLDFSSSITYIGREEESIFLTVYDPKAQAVLSIICVIDEESIYLTTAVGITGVTSSVVLDTVRATCLDGYYVVNFQ